jgi:hypothetical protein
MVSASFWETVDYWSLGAVTIAVVGEYIGERKKYSRWRFRVKKFSECLLIVALAVEWLATARTNAINNGTIAGLEKKAQDAAQLAGQLGVKVDELPTFVAQKKVEIGGQIDDLKKFSADQKRQSDALIASLNASQAKAATAFASIRADEQSLADSVNTINELRQKLHDLTTDRTISVDSVAGKLKSLGKVPFDVVVADDRESEALLSKVAAALEIAGWDWNPWEASDKSLRIVKSIPGKPNVGVENRLGISVVLAKTDFADLQKPAEALIYALRAEDLKNVTGVPLSDDDMNKSLQKFGLIHVFIGSRW